MRKFVLTAAAFAVALPAVLVGATAQAAPARPAADCTVRIVDNGVNLRTQPRVNATVVAQLQSGQRFTSPGCTIVGGDAYGPICGAEVGAAIWRVINYNGARRYLASVCTNVD